MRLFSIMVAALLIIGLAVSGCTAPKDTTPVEKVSPAPTPVATGEVMDSEITTMESDMVEMDSLLADINSIQDMNLNELEGLDF